MRDQIRSILGTTLGIDEADLPVDVSQDTCQRWSSLRHMILIASLEEEFGVRFTAEEILSMTSLESIVATFEQRGVLAGAS
ncbi:MAG: acyl carrier protein [Chloroflexi bacterium]|nr:acyl carrier protein [Chloroflexota bacterium]